MKELLIIVLCLISFVSIISFFESLMFFLCNLFYAKHEHKYIDDNASFIDKKMLFKLHSSVDNKIKKLFIVAIFSLLLSIICILSAFLLF